MNITRFHPLGSVIPQRPPVYENPSSLVIPLNIFSPQEDVMVVGRIVQESEAEPGTKLTESSLILETSRMLGSGSRVPLRFSPALKIRGGALGAGGISFFPGALVALQGKNGGGGSFLASEILAVCCLFRHSTVTADGVNSHHLYAHGLQNFCRILVFQSLRSRCV